MKFSRWQVFEHDTCDVVLCKACEAMLDLNDNENNRAPDRLPKRCPKCGALMFGRTCWIAPKE